MKKLDISIGKVILNKLIEIHIPIVYSLHNEDYETNLKIIIDPEHNNFSLVNDKLISSENSGDFDVNDLLELTDISDKLNNFVENIVKAKYIEDQV